MWAAALTMLAFTASILTEFAYVVGARSVLDRAARAAALEAAMPRATYQTVAATVDRRLAGYPAIAAAVQLRIEINGFSARGPLQVQGGDTIGVVLSVTSTEVIPSWIERLPFRRCTSDLRATSQRTVPSRRLAARVS
jgi:hypothetical protein